MPAFLLKAWTFAVNFKWVLLAGAVAAAGVGYAGARFSEWLYKRRVLNEKPLKKKFDNVIHDKKLTPKEKTRKLNLIYNKKKGKK